MTPVLIVSGGGFQGLGLLESLQALPDVTPIIADVHDENITRYLTPDYVPIPPLADESAFASSLLTLVRERGVRAVFPATARELPLLSAMRDVLGGQGVLVAVSGPALVATLLDKAATLSYLADRGFPIQAAVDPERHDFATALFGKPRHGWGGTGTVVASSLAAVRHADSQPGGTRLLWFPHLERFDEYSLDLAISPSGHVSAPVLRQRLRTTGGYAAISRSASHPALVALGCRLGETLAQSGGRGIFNIQIIVPSVGEPFISDVNPRFGTSAVHALTEGVNLPGFYLADTAQAPVAGARRALVKSVRYLDTIAVPLVQDRPEGVVFDLDDTLVDHKLWMAAKLEAAYRGIAKSWADPGAFRLAALQFIDEGERRFLIDRICEALDWNEQQRLAMIDAYRSAHPRETPLFPDVAPTLDALARAGIRVAILTDNPVPTQRSKLENSSILRHIPAYFSRESGAEKPASAAFASVASGLALAPGRLCMVGDNVFRDGVGAVRSGYACAFVLHRHGGFIHPHRSLHGRDAMPGEIHHIRDLTILRESLLWQ